MRVFRSTIALGVFLGVSSFSSISIAEQSNGWYGAVDLGYNSFIDRIVVVSTPECLRRRGKISKQSDGRSHCDARVRGLLEHAPTSFSAQGLAGLAWALSDRMSLSVLPAQCTKEGGKVARYGEYQYCRLTTATDRKAH